MGEMLNWPVLPFLIPMLTALIALAWGTPGMGRRWFIAGSGWVQIGVALYLAKRTFQGEILVLGVGGWASEFGILLVIDKLTSVMLVLVSLVAHVTVVYGFFESRLKIKNPLRMPLVQFLLSGVALALCTGDLFNLFVSFEIMLVASYALMTLEADDWDIKQAFPYIAINLFGSALFLCACGLAYALLGTLNFAELSARALGESDDGRLKYLALMLLFVFAIKAGVVPMHFWLPNSYPILPIPLLALFGGVLTKIGVYILIRLLTTVLPPDMTPLYSLLGWVALGTAVIGGIGAISRPFIRGILSFHIVSQVGVMLLAISFMSPTGIAAGLMILWHNLVVKTSLFLLGGSAALLNRTDDLSRMGHLWKTAPFLGGVFLLQAFSLAGIPPLSGFWGKYLLVVSGLEKGAYFLVAGSIVVSVLTLFSMIKIWLAAFWNSPEGVDVRTFDHRPMRLLRVASILMFVSLILGLGAEGFSWAAHQTAEQLLNPNAYREAVLTYQGKSPSSVPMP
jgi:multicomponent Na+:H+ antiporter subunit D